MLPEEEEDLESFSQMDDWDIAIRYQKLRDKVKSQKLKDHLKKISLDVVIQQAKSVLQSVSKPYLIQSFDLNQIDPSQIDDIDLDQTIEEKLSLSKTIWGEKKVLKKHSLVICVDTSLSMTGEKLVLTAIALCVALLQFQEDTIGIVAFENEANLLKSPEENISLEQLIERFLDVPAKGYTHLEKGLLRALEVQNQIIEMGEARPSCILLSDGKYTAGRDPVFLASRFHRLEVIKMGDEKSPLSLCEEMARRGHGSMREVSDLNDLPEVMYSITKDLIRGQVR